VDRIPLPELDALVATAHWRELVVGAWRFTPPLSAADAILAVIAAVGRTPMPGYSFEQLTPIDRPLAERELGLLFHLELAYLTKRLAPAAAIEATKLLLAPLGPATAFYACATITDELVTLRLARKPHGFGCTPVMLGNTLEEGVFAYDPEGVIALLFVGDED
jgi:hypothetical protein